MTKPLIYWRHKMPDELNAKIKKEPGEIVKMAIGSFGPMSAIQVQERLIPEVILVCRFMVIIK